MNKIEEAKVHLDNISKAFDLEDGEYEGWKPEVETIREALQSMQCSTSLSIMLSNLPSYHATDKELADWVRCWHTGLSALLTPPEGAE